MRTNTPTRRLLVARPPSDAHVVSRRACMPATGDKRQPLVIQCTLVSTNSRNFFSESDVSDVRFQIGRLHQIVFWIGRLFPASCLDIQSEIEIGRPISDWMSKQDAGLGSPISDLDCTK